MKKINKIIISLIAVFITTGALYAINTLIVDIPGSQESDFSGSLNTRVITLDDGMRYMNKDNDIENIGDFFTGYYYDPAYGFFKMNASSTLSDNVQVSGTSEGSCGIDYYGYKLQGYSYNPDFGFMNFNQDINNFVHICIPIDGNNDTLETTLHGYAYSPYIGFQNFDGIDLDSSVDYDAEHDSEGRFLKVDGVVSTTSQGEIDQFGSEVRVLGKITKATLRKNILQKVFASTRNAPINNGGNNVGSLSVGSGNWNSGDGVILQNGEVLYFGDMQDGDVTVSGSDAMTGNKTLVVEGGNIYITENIRGTGTLGLIAIQKGGEGGNIYIDPSVTDIHAVMYADRSVVSYDKDDGELDGSTQVQDLANQLYIYGSIFSENTIGGSLTTTCPYYISSCDIETSKKYDLNLLRRYILVQPVDEEGNAIGDKQPQFNALESNMGNKTPVEKLEYRIYPLIIEYNPGVQQSPPPFFN